MYLRKYHSLCFGKWFGESQTKVASYNSTKELCCLDNVASLRMERIGQIQVLFNMIVLTGLSLSIYVKLEKIYTYSALSSYHYVFKYCLSVAWWLPTKTSIWELLSISIPIFICSPVTCISMIQGHLKFNIFKTQFILPDRLLLLNFLSQRMAPISLKLLKPKAEWW